MSQDTWTAVDDYFNGYFIADDPILEAALADSEAAELPAINVAPNQGKLLMLLAQIQGARTILEIGTLGGYSTIWLARALPDDGHLVTLEYEPHHAAVATKNIERAGLSDKVEIRVGAALDTLPDLLDHPDAPFDFIFIDADKPNNPHYLEWAMKLARKGTVIIGDNVVRNGEVVNPESKDEKVQGTQKFVEAMAAKANLAVTALQTVGSKGYDGFAMAIVTGE